MRNPVARIALVAVTLVSVGCGDVLNTTAGDPRPGVGELTCSISSTRIYDGGPGRDGIPALTLPNASLAPQSGFSGDTRVLGVVINGEARAYPLPIMWWHEIVNDRLRGEPVVVTYCPLTGSGLAFDPRVGGELRTFGVSGLLFENNLIMFDRETESLWNQLLTGAQCGPEIGAELARIPIVETTLDHWSRLYPQTLVVTTDTGWDREYGVYPYGNYDALHNSTLMFPSSPWSRERPPKEPVLGVREPGGAVAYPFGVLADIGETVAVNDTLADRAILITYLNAQRTARAFDRTVNGQVLTFDVTDSTELLLTDHETETQWNWKGEAQAGPLEGERLQPLEDAYPLFWFAWSVYYPDTRVYQ